MMSMSSNPVVDQDPVTAFSYREMGSSGPHDKHPSESEQAPKVFSEQEAKDLLHAARVQAATETEIRLRAEYETRSSQEAAKIRQARIPGVGDYRVPNLLRCAQQQCVAGRGVPIDRHRVE